MRWFCRSSTALVCASSVWLLTSRPWSSANVTPNLASSRRASCSARNCRCRSSMALSFNVSSRSMSTTSFSSRQIASSRPPSSSLAAEICTVMRAFTASSAASTALLTASAMAASDTVPPAVPPAWRSVEGAAAAGAPSPAAGGGDRMCSVSSPRVKRGGPLAWVLVVDAPSPAAPIGSGRVSTALRWSYSACEMSPAARRCCAERIECPAIPGDPISAAAVPAAIPSPSPSPLAPLPSLGSRGGVSGDSGPSSTPITAPGSSSAVVGMTSQSGKSSSFDSSSARCFSCDLRSSSSSIQ
mmetsp:Transcript_20397/g.53015  ORF Transcript_20397/g.53015 Transcript_20397/m.53015 type:complete len:299 (-) Transcript_20397:437-1333(-)